MRHLPMQEWQDGSGNGFRIVDKRPVPAVSKDQYLRAWKNVTLSLSKLNGDIGVVRAPDYVRWEIERAQYISDSLHGAVRFAGASIEPQDGASRAHIEMFVYLIYVFSW